MFKKLFETNLMMKVVLSLVVQKIYDVSIIRNQKLENLKL